MPIENVTGWKQSSSQTLEGAKRVAQAGCDVCITCMGEFLQELKQGPKGPMKSKIQQYFMVGENDSSWKGALQKITTVLELTINGLRTQKITINIAFFNYVNPQSPSIINLAKAQFNSDVQLVRYLLHEASHTYAKTRDFGDMGYVKNDGTYRKAGLTSSDALSNADSYACAVVEWYGLDLV